MVGAAEGAVVHDAAEGELDATVDAEVGPGVGAIGAAPEDEVLAEEGGGADGAEGEIAGEGDGMPAGAGDGVEGDGHGRDSRGVLRGWHAFRTRSAELGMRNGESWGESGY